MMSEPVLSDPLLLHLSQQGVLTEHQCGEILDEHTRTGRPIREIIRDMDLLTEDHLLQHIAGYLGTVVVSLKDYALTPEVYRALPASVARMYRVLPVEATPFAFTLATSELINHDTEEELRFVLNKDVSFVVADEASINASLEAHYGDESDSVSDMLTALEGELEDAGTLHAVEMADKGVETIDIEEVASSAPVIRFVNLVLYQAVQSRASDIHFEPFEHEFKIRYRVDGALYEMSPPPKHLALPVISRIKVMSGLDISERRLPQDGRVQVKISGRKVDFRVSTLPTQFGESVVLRVLDRSALGLELENLGMPDDIYQNFLDDIVKPNGIVVVTGPTGSGKTTTLYSALRRLNKVETKILTAEQPVEYEIDGIVQVTADDRAGVTFSKILRAFLRQDPDIILVGETRDIETAQISIQASLTGHLVFSTLHTNDAPGAVTRLVDMGVEPFLIASTLECVLGTRLLRTICGTCKKPFVPDDAVLEQLKLSRQDVGDRPFYSGEGCADCNNTGYRGRTGIYEYLRISEPIRQMISTRQPTVVMRERARELGMRTLREDGIRTVLDGYTTVEEVLKYT